MSYLKRAGLCGLAVTITLASASQDAGTIQPVIRADCVGNQIVGIIGRDIYLWDRRTGKQIERIEGGVDALLGAKLSRQNLTSFASIGMVQPRSPHYEEDDAQLIAITSLRWPHSLNGKPIEQVPMRFSPDGKFYLSSCPGQNQSWLRDVGWGSVNFILPGFDADFSPSGSQVLELQKKAITLWDLPSLNQSAMIELPGTDSSFVSARFNPDGHTIVAACTDHSVRIWDAGTGKETERLRGLTGNITCAYFADRFTVVFGSTDGSVRQWDLKSGKQLLLLKNPGPVREILMGLSGRQCVAEWSANERPNDPTLVGGTLWDLTKSKEITLLNKQETDGLASFGTSDLDLCTVVGRKAIFLNTSSGGSWSVDLQVVNEKKN